MQNPSKEKEKNMEKNNFSNMFNSKIWERLTQKILKEATWSKEDVKKFLQGWDKRLKIMEKDLWNKFMTKLTKMSEKGKLFSLTYNSFENFSNTLNRLIKNENQERKNQIILTNKELEDLTNHISSWNSTKLEEELKYQLNENISSADIMTNIPQAMANLDKNNIDK